MLGMELWKRSSLTLLVWRVKKSWLMLKRCTTSSAAICPKILMLTIGSRLTLMTGIAYYIWWLWGNTSVEMFQTRHYTARQMKNPIIYFTEMSAKWVLNRLSPNLPMTLMTRRELVGPWAIQPSSMIYRTKFNSLCLTSTIALFRWRIQSTHVFGRIYLFLWVKKFPNWALVNPLGTYIKSHSPTIKLVTVIFQTVESVLPMEEFLLGVIPIINGVLNQSNITWKRSTITGAMMVTIWAGRKKLWGTK